MLSPPQLSKLTFSTTQRLLPHCCLLYGKGSGCQPRLFPQKPKALQAARGCNA